MRAKDAVGRFGEQIAAAYLIRDGIRIIDRNWRCSEGEIDIIALDREVLAIVEVKTRTSLAFGAPAEAVTAAKAARLRRLASRWIAERRRLAAPEYWPELRFDVIAVLIRPRGAPTVDHIKAAFQ